MASCGRCRAFVLIVRAICGQPWSRLAVAQSVVCHTRTIATSTRTYSREPISSVQWKTKSTSGRDERISPSSGLTQRNLSAVAASLKGQYRPHCKYDYLDLGDVDVNTAKAKGCTSPRWFLTNPELARLVADHISRDIEDEKSVILECDPGPGVLTKSLLNNGAQRVVALESAQTFLPDLHALENQLDGQLKVVNCNFKTDGLGRKSKEMEKLFTDLGISEMPWSADFPVKVVGILNTHYKEQNFALFKLVHSILERRSIFRYGRAELLVFISEKDYMRMMCKPGKAKQYQSFGVLWQIACDIELLHKEPWSSFVATKTPGQRIAKKPEIPNDHMCLVRMTPRKDLFSSIFTPNNSSTLVMMVKQLMARRTIRLLEKLDLWCPGKGSTLMGQVGLFEDVLTGQVYPHEYKQLFELMELAQESNKHWLYEEILESCRETN
ncbi:dimethyladenosine transferase 2, mitochondrial [Sardina pilchardus]|uniref:dimethyladenosine transferase 2, mitochondrial n=1 Tax=Sardina pilchardus TaxID=27697 RepID=UPI002E126258